MFLSLAFGTWIKSAFRTHYHTEGLKLRIGMRIAELRRKVGMTQVELAKRVGVSQGFIAQLEGAETENYEIKTLKRIASAIGMTLVIGFMNQAQLGQRSAPTKELVPC